jgi:hypothetical protein
MACEQAPHFQSASGRSRSRSLVDESSNIIRRCFQVIRKSNTITSSGKEYKSYPSSSTPANSFARKQNNTQQHPPQSFPILNISQEQYQHQHQHQNQKHKNACPQHHHQGPDLCLPRRHIRPPKCLPHPPRRISQPFDRW